LHLTAELADTFECAVVQQVIVVNLCLFSGLFFVLV
jgi:hypothetical protein